MADEITLEQLEAEAAAELAAEAVQDQAAEPNADAVERQEPSNDEAKGDDAEVEATRGAKKELIEVSKKDLVKLRQTRREARELAEIERKKREQLEAQLAALSGKNQTTKAMPTIESCEFDNDRYAQELSEWTLNQTRQQLADLQRQQLEEQRVALHKQRIEAEIASHYERAAMLNNPGYADADVQLRERFGDDVVDQLIDATGDGSELVLLHIGSNPERQKELDDLIKYDTTGNRALVWLGELKAKLKTKPDTRKISNAPDADRAVRAANPEQNKSAIEAKLNRLSSSPDKRALREYKKQLIAAGQGDLVARLGY